LRGGFCPSFLFLFQIDAAYAISGEVINKKGRNMNNHQIIQSFQGKPVRFYKATFKVGVKTRPTSISHQNFYLETYAIPLPDFCNAIGCDKTFVTKLIGTSKEVAQGLYRGEQFADKEGLLQSSVLIALELANGLAFNISTLHIKPLSKIRIADFQKWVLFIVSQIRKGKFQFTKNPYNEFKNAPLEYIEMLQMKSGALLSQRVTVQAEMEGISREHVYRRLRQMRGGNVITKKGVPRKMRGGI